MKYSFDPIIGNYSRILILGSMPGDESLRTQQYYANSSNQFWIILSKIYGQSVGGSYEEKLKFIHAKGIALWDVLESADRQGSQDRNFQNEVPNDFGQFLKIYGGLKAIAFNGGTSDRQFRSLVLKRQSIASLDSLKLICLPSSSRTPGKYVLSLEQKIAKWSVIAQV